MSHTVSGLLRKPTFIKAGCGQDGQSTMFGIELSEMTKDYKTQEKSYTNYKAILFAKSPAHVDYYNKALAEGSFVVVSCEKLKVHQREHNGKNYISMEMDNARLEAAHFNDINQQSQSAPARQQSGYNQAPAQRSAPAQSAPAQRQPAPNPQQGFNEPQQPNNTQDWDDDIPF